MIVTNRYKENTGSDAIAAMLAQKEIGKQTMAAFQRFLGSQIWTVPTPPPQFRIFIAAVPLRPVVQLMMRKDAEANIEVSERKADGHNPNLQDSLRLLRACDLKMFS